MATENILTQPSPQELAAAVEENLFALFRAMASLPEGQLVEGERLSYHLAFPTNPMFKGVWRARLPEDEIERSIDETVAWFEQRQAPFLFWWTGPSTQPADLGERLEKRGFANPEGRAPSASGTQLPGGGAPGMAADLLQVNEAVLARVPPGFSITEVSDEAELMAFKEVLVDGYEVPEQMAMGWVQSAQRVGIGNTPWKLYLGRLDGEPVATHILFNGGGVAGVYGVAVVPAARRMGIGAAITLQPMLEARQQGYRYAVLFSSEMGVPVYQRLGFQDTGARINRYFWRGGSSRSVSGG